LTAKLEGKQAIRSQHLEIVYISYGRQTGKQELATFDCSYFVLVFYLGGKQASRIRQLEIVHISFDIRDGRQTGKQ
jgi:hypothetical protein